MPRRPILKAKRNRRPNRTAESEKRCWAGAEHDHRTHRNTSPPFLQLGGASYDGITNMEPRRKVGYRPRSHRAPKRTTSHSARRSHATFLALGEEHLHHGLGDGHRRGHQGRLRQAPHAPAPPEPLPGLTTLMWTVPGGAQETGGPHMRNPGPRGVSPTSSRGR